MLNFLWGDEELPEENKWNLIRQYRNELLARCDWTQLPDVALTIEEKLAWGEYRQRLRDIPNDFVYADDVVLPEAPNA